MALRVQRVGSGNGIFFTGRVAKTAYPQTPTKLRQTRLKPTNDVCTRTYH